MRKEFLHKKGAENHPSSHCAVQRGKSQESMPGGREIFFLQTLDLPGQHCFQTLHGHSCLRLNLDLEKLVSLVTERSCHTPAFFVCLFFFLTNMWINTVFKKKKKRLSGKLHRYKGGWIHQSSMQKELSISTANPFQLSHEQLAEEEGFNHILKALGPN